MISTYDPPVFRPSKGPKVTLVLGVIAVVVGLMAVPIGFGLFSGGAAPATNDASEFRDDLDAEVAVPSTNEVYLEAKGYDVVAIGTGLTNPGTPKPGGGTYLDTRAEFSRPAITITGPDGNGVMIELQHNVLTYTGNGYDMVSLNWFEIDTAGTYVIDVRGQGPVTTVGIGDANTRNDHSNDLYFGGWLLVLLGVPFVLVGSVLVIGGLAWRGIDRNRGRRGPPGWPPPGGQPGPDGTMASPPPPPSPYPSSSSSSSTWEPPPRTGR